MFQRDRERSLDCNHRVTTNQSTNQKPSPLGEGGRREPDGRGELTLEYRLPTTSPPNPATAKQEPEMSRPPWGKGNRGSGGRGELALNPRLPHNLATQPTPTP